MCMKLHIELLRHPTSRATSSTVRPAPTCLKAAIICASVCLLRDMLVRLSFAKIILRFVQKEGIRLRKRDSWRFSISAVADIGVEFFGQ
jgi:hypothetical protein